MLPHWQRERVARSPKLLSPRRMAPNEATQAQFCGAMQIAYNRSQLESGKNLGIGRRIGLLAMTLRFVMPGVCLDGFHLPHMDLI